VATTTHPSVRRTSGVHLDTWRTAVWAHRWFGAVSAIGLGVVTAAVSSLPMPRGPVTTVETLVVVAISVPVGILAGYLMRSRWAFVYLALAFLATYELTRGGLEGATFGAIRLDSAYGIVAFVVGRGFHAVVTLLPMALGVSIGAALVRGSGPRRGLAVVPRAILAIAVVGLAVLVAMPASTPPILGADGQPVAGSIAELRRVEIGGAEQGLLLRGADTENPVLLYLSGGPGQSDLAFGRVLLEPLEEDFVVAIWDQRGNGTSYGAIDPTSSMTLDQAVGDTLAVAEYLRTQFDEEKIYILGESWGSTLGVLAVQRQPELFHAYIGSGQMVSQRVTDQLIWRDLLAYAEDNDDWGLYDQVLTFGEPPYRDTPWANSFVLGYYEALTPPYTPPAAYQERGERAGLGMFGVLGSEYGFVDKANIFRGLIDSFSILYPQLQEVDFRDDVTRLEVPVYVFDGANELSGRRDLSHEWFEALSAPSKALITYADAGHAPAFEHADDLHRLLVDEIVPATYGD